MKMSLGLDTLLEAAKYIELQELQQREAEKLSQTQQQQAIIQQIPRSLDNAAVQQQQPQNTPQQQQSQQNKTPPPPVYIKQEPQRSSPIPNLNQAQRIFHNSFDIINPLVIDEGGEQKRKQPPIVFRSGTREVHNKLEKHRRAHLKECFETLKKQLPSAPDEKKTSNLSILHSALRFIQTLRRKERELEHEMERLAREKIANQQKLAVLKKEVASQCDGVDFSTLLPEISNSPQTMSKEGIHQESLPSDTRSQDLVSSTSPDQRMVRPTLPRPVAPATSTVNGVKEGSQVQTTALSVLPVSYPGGLVLQKVAIVPKGLTDLPLVPTPVAHFIAAPQQIGGKVVPLVNAQYVVKPAVVVVSTPSRPS